MFVLIYFTLVSLFAYSLVPVWSVDFGKASLMVEYQCSSTIAANSDVSGIGVSHSSSMQASASANVVFDIRILYNRTWQWTLWYLHEDLPLILDEHRSYFPQLYN